MYDIYLCEGDIEGEDSVDGGLCTGTLTDAVEMASDQARRWIGMECTHEGRGDPCDMCGHREIVAGDIVTIGDSTLEWRVMEREKHNVLVRERGSNEWKAQWIDVDLLKRKNTPE